VTPPGAPSENAEPRTPNSEPELDHSLGPTFSGKDGLVPSLTDFLKIPKKLGKNEKFFQGRSDLNRLRTGKESS